MGTLNLATSFVLFVKGKPISASCFSFTLIHLTFTLYTTVQQLHSYTCSCHPLVPTNTHHPGMWPPEVLHKYKIHHIIASIRSKTELEPLVLYCIVLKGWSLLPNALQPFQIYWAPPNLDIRTWICRLHFDRKPIFSGLRFFNEPEISDSGPPA